MYSVIQYIKFLKNGDSFFNRGGFDDWFLYRTFNGTNSQPFQNSGEMNNIKQNLFSFIRNSSVLVHHSVHRYIHFHSILQVSISDWLKPLDIFMSIFKFEENFGVTQMKRYWLREEVSSTFQELMHQIITVYSW